MWNFNTLFSSLLQARIHMFIMRWTKEAHYFWWSMGVSFSEETQRQHTFTGAVQNIALIGKYSWFVLSFSAVLWIYVIGYFFRRCPARVISETDSEKMKFVELQHNHPLHDNWLETAKQIDGRVSFSQILLFILNNPLMKWFR